MTIDQLRFGAVSADGRRSAPWIAFTNGRDLYLAVRAIAGKLKLSFHASGIGQISVVDEYFQHLPELGLPRPPSRHFKRWHMPAFPNDGVAHVASVIFASRFLRTGTTAKLMKPVHWFPAPHQGALEVGFFYGRLRATYEGPRATGLEVKFFTMLSDSRVVTVVARHTEFAEKQILDQCFRQRRVYAFDPELWKLAPGRRLKNLDMFPWSDVKDGEAIAVWAIAGVDVRRDR